MSPIALRACSLLLLCALFSALALNCGVYPLLSVSALGAAWLLFRTYSDTRPVCLRQGLHPASGSGLLPPASDFQSFGRFVLPLLFPLPFMVFTALSPGRLFSDLPVAEVMLSAYLCGVGVGLLDVSARRTPTPCLPEPVSPPQLLALPMLLVLLWLCAELLFFFCTGQSNMLWDTRLTLLFDHPNVLGYVASWAVLFGAVCLHGLRRRLLPLWLAAMAAGLFIVAHAGSRGVYAGLALSAVPVLFMLYRPWMGRVLVVAAVVGLALFWMLPQRHQQRLESALRNPMSDVTVLSRKPIWDAALDGFTRSPVLGNGLRTFGDHHERYVLTHRTEFEVDGMPLEFRVANPHSLYMGLLYAYGVAGIALLLFAVGCAVHAALRKPGPDAAFFLASLLFVLGAGVVDYALHRKEGILLFFLPMGVVAGRAFMEQLTVKEHSAGISGARGGTRTRAD